MLARLRYEVMDSVRGASLLAVIVLFAVAILVVDIQTPHGVAEWVLYLPLPLLTVGFERLRLVLAVSALCSAFIVAGFFLSPQGIEFDWALGNRVMALMGLGVMTAASGAIVRHAQRLTALKDDLLREIDQRVVTERTLRESEERLRLAMEGGGMGTRDVNLLTGEEVWSATQFRILGYEPSPDGRATSDMWRVRVHPEDRRWVRETKYQAQVRRALYHLEYRLCRPDHSDQKADAWVEVFGQFHHDESGAAIRFVGVCFDITARKDLERELLEVTARQQQDIGQELHDGVGQELTGLGLIAHSLAQRLPENSAERVVATRLVAGLGRVHQQVRNLSRGIMPVHLDANGLPAALEEFAARVAGETGVAVGVECPDGIDLPDNATATQVFRIAQEAVANALRHAAPRRVRIVLTAEPAGLRMAVEDDGGGFLSGRVRGDGLGIRIMRYRAGLIGGTLRIGVADGGGTTVTLTLSRSKTDGDGHFG